MSDTPYQAWAVLAVSALPTVAGGLFMAYRWISDRSERQSTRAMTREERREQEMDAMASSLTKQQGERVSELRADNADLRARNVELARDRDRGWDLARYWHGSMQDMLRSYRNMRHDLRNTQQIVKTMYLRFLPEEISPDYPPEPDLPTTPMGLEDPK